MITPSDARKIAELARRDERNRLKKIVARLVVLYHSTLTAQLERHLLREIEAEDGGVTASAGSEP